MKPVEQTESIAIEDSSLTIELTKSGKPRKRKPKTSNTYFTEDTQNAIVEYVKSENQDFRNTVYRERIEYGFFKLTQNIIHTFKFYYTDGESVEDVQQEVIAFLLEKLKLYKPEKGKAYSYFGTIAKRYLIVYNENNYRKLQEKVDVDESDEDQMHLYENDRSIENMFNENNFMDQYIKYIDTHIYKLFPKKQDAQTADAIVELFRKRETLEIFNKKALYIYIREITDVSTPQITKIIKKLKLIYVQLYNEYYNNGYIKI
jgi:hypothetical protein